MDERDADLLILLERDDRENRLDEPVDGELDRVPGPENDGDRDLPLLPHSSQSASEGDLL